MSFGELLKDITGLLAEANKFDKNAQQQKFLKELRSISRKISKQEKTQRRNLIFGIILSSIASGIIGYVLTDDGRENILIFVGYVPENKVYDGTTYKSYSGGFYMIKPATSWELGTMDSLDKISDASMIKHEYFIDGYVLENSATTVLMAVWVYSKEYTPHVPLEIPFDDINKKINSQRNVLSEEIRSSLNGDWIEKESIHMINGKQQMERYKIQIYNEKLYMFQAILWSPVTASDKDKNDFDDAWNSVKFCSNSVNCND